MELHTVETFAEKNNITRQSAINKLSELKKKGKVKVSGKTKRIYEVHSSVIRQTNGFYDVVNKYGSEKLQPEFKHFVYGRYHVENAIIDGLKIGGVRTLRATMHLFRHVKNWKFLFDLAEKRGVRDELIDLYLKARKTVRVGKIPERYLS